MGGGTIAKVVPQQWNEFEEGRRNRNLYSLSGGRVCGCKTQKCQEYVVGRGIHLPARYRRGQSL